MLSLIFLAVYFFVSLLMAVTQYKINFSMKNVVLENTLPKEATTAPETKKILQSFLKRSIAASLLFGILLCSIFVIPYDSIIFLFFFVSLFGCLGVQFILYIKAIEEMHELKLEKGWTTETSKIVVDLKTMRLKNRKLFPVWCFLFPIIVFIIITVFSVMMNKDLTQSSAFSMLFIIDISTFAVFLLTALWTYYLVWKMPVHAVTKDQQINQKVNDVQKSFYGKMILALLIFAVLLSGSLTLSFGKYLIAMPIFIIVAAFVFVGYSFYLVFGYRRETNQLLARIQPLSYENEDQYWRYGIYINPNDQRLFVPQRITMKLSLNLGRRAGKAIAAGTGIFLLLVFSGLILFTGYNDFTPHPFQANVSQGGHQLVLKNGISSKKLNVKDIQSIEMISNQVKNASKINGMNTDNYDTGTFSVKGKESYLLIFRKTAKVVHIRTKSYNYYINDRTLEDTEQMYKKLQKEIK
ncbi:MAG: hypothetical protein LBV19_11075 [Streptococcaceae bacterium]|jgi:uncharacterized membrane protein|nr:hypothetical protein [Streptococcaceae bacterium]